MRWLLLMLAAGCAKDPCDGQAAACLTVHVDGSGVSQVDALRIRLTGGIDATKTSTHGSAIALPVQVAVVLDQLTAPATLDLNVDGLVKDSVVGSGAANVSVAPGQHLKIPITLRAGGVDLGDDIGGASLLQADRSVYDFGTIVAGNSSGMAIIRVTNTGSVVSGALTTAITGPDQAEFVIDSDGCGSQVLAPLQSCAVSLHLAAQSEGSPMATLTVSGSPGGSASVTLQATVVPPGTIAISPPSKSFDPVVVAQTGADVTFTVSNTDPTATGMLTVALSGTDKDSFGITADTCSGLALAMPATCTVNLRFQPASAGAKAASLLVSGMPGGTGVAALAGNGLAGATLSGPPSVDFSSVVVGNTSAESSVAVSNSGATSTGAVGVSITGANPGDFAVSMDGCNGLVLTPGSAPCTLKLTFSPAAAGMRAAVLHLTAMPGGPLDIPLQGTGLAPAALVPSPASHPFGTISVGVTSPAQQFNITNTGDMTTGSIAVTLIGANSDEFVTSNDTCSSQTLMKNGACAVLVAFKPKSFGSKSASLQVSASPGGTTTASLSGFGQDQVLLTVNTNGGAGGGTVSATGLSCAGATCTGNYDRGSMVTLSETPDASSLFNGWSIPACGMSAMCTVTMDMAKTVTATFVPSTLTLTLNNTFKGGAAATVSSTPSDINCSAATCSKSFAYNTAVTLTAHPATGTIFVAWGGDCAGSGSCMVTMTAAHTVTATFSPPNVAFVTANTFTPSSFAGLTASGEGLAGADSICRNAAAAAALPGSNWVAFLSRDAVTVMATSYPQVNAIDRLINPSNGSAVNGWVRTDGLPVFATKADVAAGKMLYPLRLDENKADTIGSAKGAMAATGSNQDGNLSSSATCADWGSGLAATTYQAGDATKATNGWLIGAGTPTCNASARIYCFQVDYDVTLPALPGTGRVAFTAPFVPGTGGIGDADGVCAGAAAGHFSGTFRALLATASASADRGWSRATPWSRPDGVVIAPSAADLFTAPYRLQAPINVTATLQYNGEANVFCGAGNPTLGGGTNLTCNSWTYTNADNNNTYSGGLGSNSRTDSSWFGANGVPCSYANGWIYCLQN